MGRSLHEIDLDNKVYFIGVLSLERPFIEFERSLYAKVVTESVPHLFSSCFEGPAIDKGSTVD